MKEGAGVAKAKETYVLDKFQADALNFIEANKENPFFLYYAINMPHANNEAGYFTGDGMEVPDYGQYTDKDWPNPEKGFAQMMTLIDNVVGEVDEKLKELGISENTMIVFVSDNGPHNEGGHDGNFFDSNGIYRGFKRDLYEGGIRVPLIVKWPGKVPAGTVSDTPVATWDFLPTFAEMVDSESPADIDGFSFLPTLLGMPEKQKEHPYLYWEFYELGGRQAIRQGDWKYVKLNVRDQSIPVIKELYNLRDDPSETENIIGENQEKANIMDALIKKAHTEHELLSLFSGEKDAETRF
ncbi:MAG: sulfatase-like hydrolase/transferase [Flavobacteriaceae bacterium]